MKVLSLFDGISCGMVALERVGIKVYQYYACEIDTYASAISEYNYKNIIRLGDVFNVGKETISSLGKIDLIIGGSPCQSLSSVNVNLKKEEKGVNGTGKSSLFWEYVRVLNIVKSLNPNVKFLLENVGSATNEDKRIIDNELGVKGVSFNSKLLSAQNRNRVYWTNINFEVPSSRINVFMKDIKQDVVEDKYYLTQKMYDCIMSKGTKGWQSGKMEIDLEIARPLLATMHKMHRADTDNYISTNYKPKDKTNVRKLTPIECERLQTLPDNYTKYGLINNDIKTISDTRRYIALGNGWTVDVIAYILRGLK